MKRILVDLSELNIKFSDVKKGPGRPIVMTDVLGLVDALDRCLRGTFGDEFAPCFRRHQEWPFWLPKNLAFGGELGDKLFDQVKSWNDELRTVAMTAKTAADKAAPQDKTYLSFMAEVMADQLDNIASPYGCQFVVSGGSVHSYMDTDDMEGVRLNPAGWALLTVQSPMS